MDHHMKKMRRLVSRMDDRVPWMQICIRGTQNRLSRMKNRVAGTQNFMRKTQICIEDRENLVKGRRFWVPGMDHRIAGMR